MRVFFLFCFIIELSFWLRATMRFLLCFGRFSHDYCFCWRALVCAIYASETKFNLGGLIPWNKTFYRFEKAATAALSKQKHAITCRYIPGVPVNWFH